MSSCFNSNEIQLSTYKDISVGASLKDNVTVVTVSIVITMCYWGNQYLQVISVPTHDRYVLRLVTNVCLRIYVPSFVGYTFVSIIGAGIFS